MTRPRPGGGARNGAGGALLDPQRRGEFAQVGTKTEPVGEIAAGMMTGRAFLLAGVGDMGAAARFGRRYGLMP